MPEKARVQELIGYALDGRLVEALREFYAEDAAVQENSDSPRVGLPTLIAHEEKFLLTVADLHHVEAVALLVDGDHAAVQWSMDWTDRDGRRNQIEEVALQTWRGDKIVRERYFYDPHHLSPPSNAPQAAP